MYWEFRKDFPEEVSLICVLKDERNVSLAHGTSNLLKAKILQ